MLHANFSRPKGARKKSQATQNTQQQKAREKKEHIFRIQVAIDLCHP